MTASGGGATPYPDLVEAPTATKVREKRAEYGLTAKEAASLVHSERDTWYRWENGSRSMDAARWELFLIKLGERKGKVMDHAGDRIDTALDKVLRAAGTRLRNYAPLTQDELRKAMREVMSAEYIAGSSACGAALEYTRRHARP